MQPLVSVVMPSYNGSKYIRKAIESILYQTYKKLELIIVEDYSNDCSEDIIRSYSDSRIKLIVNERNMGIAASTNRGIASASGKYIALLDDDDIATTDRISLQVNYFEQHKDIDILGGRTAIIDEKGRYISCWPVPRNNPKFIKAKLLFENVDFGNGSVMIRKEFIDNNGLLYKDNCMGMQDFRFLIESSKIGNISSIDKIVLKLREHSGRESYRTRLQCGKEREELYAKFQRDSFRLSGFDLEMQEFAVINRIFKDGSVNGKSWEDWKSLYDVFKKVLCIAKEKKIDYYPELECMCKKKLQDIYTKINSFDYV